MTAVQLLSDTTVVRENPTDIRVTFTMTHLQGLVIQPVTGVDYNFNVTFHLSDVDCSEYYSYHWGVQVSCFLNCFL